VSGGKNKGLVMTGIVPAVTSPLQGVGKDQQPAKAPTG
jgi:hypothetical protein